MKFAHRYCAATELPFSLSPRESSPVGYCTTPDSHQIQPERTAEKCSKQLPINIQTIGEWIQVKRTEKNLTSGHVAAKMGIAHACVRSWESGKSQPDGLQLAVLEEILGRLKV